VPNIAVENLRNGLKYLERPAGRWKTYCVDCNFKDLYHSRASLEFF